VLPDVGDLDHGFVGRHEHDIPHQHPQAESKVPAEKDENHDPCHSDPSLPTVLGLPPRCTPELAQDEGHAKSDTHNHERGHGIVVHRRKQPGHVHVRRTREHRRVGIVPEEHIVSEEPNPHRHDEGEKDEGQKGQR